MSRQILASPLRGFYCRKNPPLENAKKSVFACLAPFISSKFEFVFLSGCLSDSHNGEVVTFLRRCPPSFAACSGDGVGILNVSNVGNVIARWGMEGHTTPTVSEGLSTAIAPVVSAYFGVESRLSTLRLSGALYLLCRVQKTLPLLLYRLAMPMKIIAAV